MDQDHKLKGRRAVEFMGVEQFVDVIKETRVLWDPQDSGYSSKQLRDEAWLRVAHSMIEDFDQRPVPEQDEISIAIQKKWRCLRTCYNREVLKQTEEKGCTAIKPTKRKEYMYFEKLRFLDTIPKRAPNVSSDERGKDEDGNQIFKRARRSSVKLSESDEQNYLKQEAAVDAISTEFDASSSIDCSNLMHEDTSISNPLNIHAQPHTITTCVVDEDEDKMFLLSVLPDLKKIAQENKLRVKSDILLVLSNGQSPGSYASPFYRHS